MYAIIEDSGTQIKVSSGDVIDIDLRDLGDAKTITFDRVLAVGNTDDADAAATIGTPYVDGVTVTAEVVKTFRDKKVDVVKYKRRKGYRRKQGHHQTMIRVKVDAISGA